MCMSKANRRKKQTHWNKKHMINPKEDKGSKREQRRQIENKLEDDRF